VALATVLLTGIPLAGSSHRERPASARPQLDGTRFYTFRRMAAGRTAIDSTLTPPVATIRLTGVVPAGAPSLTWAYGWTFAPYAASVVRHSHAPADTQWVEGASANGPFEIGKPASTIRNSQRRAAAWCPGRVICGGTRSNVPGRSPPPAAS
jgi:hypothetical protein